MQQGQQAVQNKNISESINWFRQAVKEKPKDAQANACLGQSLCWDGQQAEGFKYLRQAGQLLLKKTKKNRDVKLVLDLADQMQHWNDYQGSMMLCKQALKLDANAVRGYQLLALAHMRLNQRKPALAAGKQALARVPDSAMLSILVGTLEINDGQLDKARARLEKVVRNPLLKAEEKFRAHKELALLLDKLKDYGEVFAHLHAAGEVSGQLPEVKRQDAAMVPAMLKDYRTGFTHEVLDRWAGETFTDDRQAPVFVMGFMRTGTTLTQEVLGAHPQVFIADETDLWSGTVAEIKRRVSHAPGSVPQQLAALTRDDVKALRAYYWQRAQALFGNAYEGKVFLDKTTMNSIDLGFINVIFPDAKIIFLVRDPRDVCLSCIMQTMIPTPSTVHLNKWQDTARFFADVMDWWLTVKPRLSLVNMELKYEDAVSDFEATFTRVFDLMGLKWDPAVTEFYKKAAGKVVASPSFSQVAQPLYSSSVGRWRNYAAEYDVVQSTLQPYLDAYHYV